MNIWKSSGQARLAFHIQQHHLRWEVKQKRLRIKKLGYNTYLYHSGDLQTLFSSHVKKD